MERIGVRELRQHASRHLARVKDGESIEVTDRGELVAMLVPPERSRTVRERLIADGTLTPASAPTGRLRSPRPVPIGMGGASTQQLLDEGRGERL